MIKEINSFYESIFEKVSLNNNEAAKQINQHKQQILNQLQKSTDNSAISSSITFPRTENLKKDLEDEDAIKFEYDINTTPEDIYPYLKKDIIQKHHSTSFLTYLFNSLFTFDDPDPKVFQHIFIQYYSKPILIATNKDIKGGKFSMLFEITRLKQQLNERISDKVYQILVQDYSLLNQKEKDNNLIDKLSRVTFIIVGLSAFALYAWGAYKAIGKKDDIDLFGTSTKKNANQDNN